MIEIRRAKLPGKRRWRVFALNPFSNQVVASRTFRLDRRMGRAARRRRFEWNEEMLRAMLELAK